MVEGSSVCCVPGGAAVLAGGAVVFAREAAVLAGGAAVLAGGAAVAGALEGEGWLGRPAIG